jgi:hypothetical protein
MTEAEMREMLAHIAELITDEYFADYRGVYNPDFPEEITIKAGAGLDEEAGTEYLRLRVERLSIDDGGGAS